MSTVLKIIGLKYSFALIGLLLSISTISQTLVGDSLSRKSAFKIKRMAKQSLQYNDPYTAIEFYEIYVKKRPKKSEAKMKLAQMYQQTRNYQSALGLYSKITNDNPESFPKAWFFKGQCEKNLQKLEESRESFESFNKYYKSLSDRSIYRRLVKAELEGLDIADSLFSHQIPATVKPISGINQRHTESAPMFVSETEMYYASMSEDKLPIVKMTDSLEQIPRLKIFTAKLENGVWTKTGMLKSDINDPVKHVSNPIIDPEGKYLFYTVCTENWQGKTLCKIYQSRKVNDKWKKGKELGFGINENGFTSTQPAIGLEEKRQRLILYFVSDRPGGKGGLDLYWTQYNKRDEEWSKPRNAGGKVNSKSDEETPWYDQTRGTLYFSSNGHPGIGGMDVFSSVGERSSWSEPEIMGVPINSTTDDVYFKKQPRDRYQTVVSNRPGSLSLWKSTCCDDIYEIYYPTNVDMMLKVIAREIPSETDQKFGANPPLAQAVTKVYLYDPKTGEKYFITSDSISNGEAELSLEPGKMYLVEVEKPGYFTQSKIIDLRKNNIGDIATSEFDLQHWDEKPIAVPNIYFEFGSSEMTEDSKNRLDSTLMKIMNENPLIIVEVGAHTDNKGSDELNLKLSQKRAESITKHLTSRGIDKDRITAKGYGETKPIAPNINADGSDNPEGRAQNRRVDFKVIGTKMDIQQSE